MESRQEEKLDILRNYWLGEGFEIEIPLTLSSKEELESLISERLISDIVKMTLKYRNNADITPLREKEDNFGRARKYDKKLYRNDFERNFKHSTYTYNLIKTLANGGDARKLNIPYDSLSLNEISEIERRLAFNQKVEKTEKNKLDNLKEKET